MKRIHKTVLIFIYLLVVAFILSGCNGLPDSLLKQAKGIPERMTKQQALISEEKTAFDNMSAHKEWRFIQPYLEKEQWVNNFTAANKDLTSAKSLYELKIVPMMDRNDSKEGQNFTALLYSFNNYIDASTQSAKKTKNRITFLIHVRDTAPAIYEKAGRDFEKINQATDKLTTKSNKAISDYGHKKNDIVKRITALSGLTQKGTDSITQIDDQFNKATDTDYAVFGDEAVNLSNTLTEILAYQKKTSAKLDELYRSYTRVLADQRVDYFMVIGRTTWCEGDYCGNGTTRHYPPVKVDEKMFDYFDKLNINLIATLRTSWGKEKFKLNIPNAAWNVLGLDKKWTWPRGDDYADYWVEKTYMNTYHKYIEIVNDKMTEGQWLKVNEDNFWSQYNNLGMAILTKPYGYYEEDVLTDAQPIGMVTIAKPTLVNGVASGSNQYGTWRHENGRSFWHYYGMYSMFSLLGGRSRYYYNDWYGYSRYPRGKAYYGQGDEYGTWGSSTYNNTRYRNSSFAKRNPANVQAAKNNRSTRSSRVSSSLRGAGVTSRSRGPAGGGK